MIQVIVSGRIATSQLKSKNLNIYQFILQILDYISSRIATNDY
jgi:hypothetical protein